MTTTGFYLLGVRGNTLFTGGKYRLDFNTYFFSFPSAFWGIGYDSATYGKAGAYKRLQNQVKVDFMVRVAKDFYVGTNASFNYIKGKDFTNIEQLRGENPLNINAGLGVFLMYDSRDFITNAYRGIYFKAEQRFLPIVHGKSGGVLPHRGTVECLPSSVERGGDGLRRTRNVQLWKSAVDDAGPDGGGSSRMRGYYEGRYRDNNLIEAQVELRQKVYGRNGIVIWGGAGNVFPSFSKFNGAQSSAAWYRLSVGVQEAGECPSRLWIRIERPEVVYVRNQRSLLEYEG